MSNSDSGRFSERDVALDIAEGSLFAPAFDGAGLLPAIVSDASSGKILMFAWMNTDALALTLDTGLVHFWSRSRKRIWKKGEESGNALRLIEMRTDCDQDVVWVRVAVEGDGQACHTGRRSCFYRKVARDPANGSLSLAPEEGI